MCHPSQKTEVHISTRSLDGELDGFTYNVRLAEQQVDDIDSSQSSSDMQRCLSLEIARIDILRAVTEDYVNCASLVSPNEASVYSVL